MVDGWGTMTSPCNDSSPCSQLAVNLSCSRDVLIAPLALLRIPCVWWDADRGQNALNRSMMELINGEAVTSLHYSYWETHTTTSGLHTIIFKLKSHFIKTSATKPTLPSFSSLFYHGHDKYTTQESLCCTQYCYTHTLCVCVHGDLKKTCILSIWKDNCIVSKMQ